MIEVEQAIARRCAIEASGLTVYRVVHGWSEGLVGLEVDRYGDALVLEAKSRAMELVPGVIEALDRWRRFDTIVVRERPGGVAVVRGDAGPVTVEEGGLLYRVELARNGNPGLYLDARPARAWVRAHSEGRRVLNLFAFSGSLGVAAAAGGARGVVHLDSSQPALDWCRRNHELNRLPIDDRSLARINVYQHLRKAATARQRFDAIIADPPPGPEDPRASDRTPGQRGPVALVPQLARMLSPGGWLLGFFHHGLREAGEAERAALAAAASAGVELTVIWRATSGDDFPEEDPRNKLQLLAFERR